MFFNNSKAVLAKLALVALTLTIVGCEPAKPKADTGAADSGAAEKGHEHAETLADAVKELEGMCATIKAAFAKDDAEAAHGPMHDIGHVLEEIPDLAAKSTLDDAGKAEVKKAAETLFEAFSAVDESMHGSGGKKYSDVSESIDAALKVIVDKSKG
ncbi:MAG: hypothetical protein SFV81_10775 [Pirellulaceae bacterium]|nr:hypothetical protein [Pirellulaceae bacterium]